MRCGAMWVTEGLIGIRWLTVGSNDHEERSHAHKYRIHRSGSRFQQLFLDFNHLHCRQSGYR